jgi:apolipoprotein N-acyltransferase
MLAFLIALFAGSATVLGFAPFNFYPIPIITLAILVGVLRRVSVRQTFIRVYGFGLGFFGFGISWVHVSMHNFGNMPLALAIVAAGILVLFLALYPALWLMLGRFISKRLRVSSPGWLGVMIPVFWVLSEWFRSWFLTGFPWLFLGASQADSVLGAWLPLVGEFGVSLVVMLLASWLVIVLFYAKVRRFVAAGLLVVLGIITLVLERQSWTSTVEKPLTVALVQGNIPISMKWKPGHIESTLNTYWARSTPFLNKADLIVWPETAIPTTYQDFHQIALPQFEQQLRNSRALLVSGIIFQQGEQLFNSMIAFGDGKQQFYHKRHLVPFGEYVPLADSLVGFILDGLDIPMSMLSAGGMNQPAFTTRTGVTLGATVCYEVTYADLVGEREHETQVLLTVSNDGWFGDSLARSQHLQIAQVRARENAKPMIRATNNGLTAVIEYDGLVVADLPPDHEGTLFHTITPRQGSTPFARYGIGMPASLLIILVLSLIVLRHARYH